MARVRFTPTGKVYLYAECSGEQHRARILPDGTVSNPHHDSDADAVMLALGAAPHGCAVAMRMVEAARESLAALSGRQDPPGVRFHRRGQWGTQGDWSDGVYCNRSCQRSLGHLASPAHATLRHQAPGRAVARLTQWLAEQNGESEVLDTWGRSNPQLVTARYLDAADKILGRGQRYGFGVGMRMGGVRVEWLASLAGALSPGYLPPHGDKFASFVNTLIGARNIDPLVVAGFVNAGFRSHIYTYAKANVTPADALEVFRANYGERSLAEFMSDGENPHAVIARVRSAR